MTDEEAATRDNYKTGKVYNYLDGDKQSQAYYATGEHTLVSDETRVYKGGSWADRAFWLSPGARRYLDQNKSSRTIGFRCAMTRTGSPSGNDDVGGHQFNTKRKRGSRRY